MYIEALGRLEIEFRVVDSRQLLQDSSNALKPEASKTETYGTELPVHPRSLHRRTLNPKP